MYLCKGLDLIESTNMKPFQKEMVAEFFALKGLFYSQMEKYGTVYLAVI